MGDKVLFEKLLHNYEKQEEIVDKLTQDDDFFLSQLEVAKSGRSVQSMVQNDQFVCAELEGSRDLETVNEESSDNSIIKNETKHNILTQGTNSNKLIKLGKKMSIFFKRKHSFKRPKKCSTERKATENVKPGENISFSVSSLFSEGKSFKSPPQNSLSRSEVSVFSKSSRGSYSVQTNEREFGPECTSLSSDLYANYIQKRNRENPYTLQHTESFIEFSERQTPLDYLLQLGFSIDDAANMIKDQGVKNRLNAAINEACTWTNQINTTQGVLLYLVAYKTKPKTMLYFLQLVEAIVYKRINDAVKLIGFLKVLEKLEDGDIDMEAITGILENKDEENESTVRKHLRTLFTSVYKIAESEATQIGTRLHKDSIFLLRILATKYHTGLYPHRELIAKYIGQGLLNTEAQLEAAMIFLSRLDTADVDVRAFEEYCAIYGKLQEFPRQYGKDTR